MTRFDARPDARSEESDHEGATEPSDVAVGLARVVADHPAAVLVVDLDSQQVVYANSLAGQLAPGAELPVPVAQWSRAAGLQDADGQVLEDGVSSLQRVASGQPVAGEQVTARRESDVSAAREDLWVIGMPLSDAPPPLDRRALVVFLPLRDRAGIDAARRSSFELQHRAVLSSEVSFSISDPNLDDDPLVWINPAFEAITGYRASEVLGSNCRFLQGDGTDPRAVQRIRDGLIGGGTVTETLLNYRADGTAFWNHIVISPIFDSDGKLTHHVGVQSDVTARVDADRERDQALAAAERANRRFAALAAISDDLTNGLSSGNTSFAQLPAVIARHMEGWVLAASVTDSGQLGAITVAGSGPARAAGAERLGVALGRLLESDPTRQIAQGFLARLPNSTTPHGIVSNAVLMQAANILQLTEKDADLLRDIAGSSWAITPVTGRGKRIGVLMLIRDSSRGGFDDAELTAVADLGVRTGIALDNARLYAREHEAAVTLQRSLLPRLPTLDGFEVAATYQPARTQAEVGGDWYDVLQLPGRSGIGVAIGDVMGHDLRAAAAMGQLRSVLRSYAWAGDAPAAVLSRLDELVRGLDMAALATCAYAVVCLEDEGGCTVSYTLAGHPPPMIRRPGGEIELLDEALTSPIGVAGDPRAVPQAEIELAVGACLVLYTDGLIERRDRDIDAGLTALADTIRAAPEDASAEELCSHIVSGLTSPDHDDDVCVLVLRRLR